MYIFYTFIVYYIIKMPINNLIYSNISLWIIAFTFAVLSGWFISKLTKKLFKYLFENIKVYEYILNIYVLDSLISLAIDYFPSLICIVPEAPRFGPLVQALRLERNDDLVTRGNNIYRRIRRLEPIVSAIDKDRSNDKHGALYDVLNSHIIDSRNELITFKKEIFLNNQYVPHNGGDNIFIARYWEKVIGFEFYTESDYVGWDSSSWDTFTKNYFRRSSR